MEEAKKKHTVSASFLVSSVYPTTSPEAEAEAEAEARGAFRAKKHFVLVHGACHGAWCWYKIVPLLKSSGHKVTALDLAASGIDPKQATDLRSISEYFQPLTDFMESLHANEKVVLVGHSLGGLAISQAMEKFPEKISVAIFVTAAMPGPPPFNISALHEEFLKEQGPLRGDIHYTYDDGPDNPPRTLLFHRLFLSLMMYQLSSTQDLELATMSARPVALFGVVDTLKELQLTEKYASVKRGFIKSEKDNMCLPIMQRLMIKFNPPDVVEEVEGSDHMVMMSKPNELSVKLQAIADKY